MMPENYFQAISSGLVSVIIPAYRAERFLEATLATVARQRYPHWEVIVVEDGTTGPTAELVKAFGATVPNHRVVYRRHDTNCGQAAARNTAIQEARGEFLALLDSDDLWQEGHLHAAVDALNTQGGEIAYSTVVCFDTETGITLGVWGPTIIELRNFPDSLFERSFITPSATVLRRSVIETVGHFDEASAIRGSEDIDFWLRSARANMRFIYLRGCHCLYRKNDPNAATSNMARLQRAHVYALEKNQDLLRHAPFQCRQILVKSNLIAGHLNRTTNWRLAAQHYVKAWQWNPRRVDRLLLAVLSPFWFLYAGVRWRLRQAAWMKGGNSALT